MPELSMKQILDTCQRGSQHHTKMLKLIRIMYANMEFEEFFTEFVRLLKYNLVVYKREPSVERTIEFLCKFISSPEVPAPSSQTTENDTNTTAMTEDDPDNILLIKILEFLLEHHSAIDRAVRFRCCQMINKLLNNLAQNAMIDDDLFDRICTCMLERMRDKVHLVRQNAVLAISRLQDPSDDDCPIIKAYLFLMTKDSSPCVRRAVLGVIGPSTKTVPFIIERTKDVNESVRQVAYTVIAEKIHIKSLSIAQRLEILEKGLKDRVEIVKETCSKKMLQRWLCAFGGNVLELLRCLDVENSMETCEQMVDALFKQSVVGDLVANFDILDENFLITNVTCESSMYWRSLLKYVKSLGRDHEELLENILPNCLMFASYLKKYVEENEACDDIEKQIEIDFILQQLLMVIDSMDLSDETGRRALENILHDMLVSDNMRCEIVQYILPRLKVMKTSADSLVNYLAETISEIREPLTIVEKSLSKEQKRNIDLKTASIRVKLNQVREEMEECVRNQEFVRAAELKSTMSELDTEKSQLLESAEPKKEEVRTEKNDTGTMLKCMTIIHEMLKLLPLKTLSPTLQMILDSQILPGIQNGDENVRNEAVWSLGLCCLLKQEVAVLYLPLLMQISKVDTEEVRTTALKCTFDLIHLYGLDVLFLEPTNDKKDTSADLFDTSDHDNSPPSVTTAAGEDDGVNPVEFENLAAKLVALLSSFLDSESEDMCNVAAEGLAKLLLSGRIVSSKILSHLLILWFNPVTEDNAYLRQCLGAFFPIYSFTARAHQEIMEEAFMPTLKTIMEAPTSSPLSDIDISKVSDVLVQLVNTKRLFIYSTIDTSKVDNPGHDSICMKVCDVIISKSDLFDLKYWTRILNQLDLSPDETNLKDVFILCEKMIDIVKESNCLKAIKKFKKTIEDQLAVIGKPMVTCCSPVSGAESTDDKTLNVTPNSEMDHLSTTLNNTTLDPDTKKTTTRKTKAKNAVTPADSKALSSVLSKSSSKRNAKRHKTESEQENPLNKATRKSKINKNLEPLLQEEEETSSRSTRSALYEVSNSDV